VNFLLDRATYYTSPDCWLNIEENLDIVERLGRDPKSTAVFDLFEKGLDDKGRPPEWRVSNCKRR
jgi:hypothetical protein